MKQGTKVQTIGLVSGLAAILVATGCSDILDDDTTHSRVCTERASEVRVVEDRCNGVPDDDDGHSGVVWLYYGHGSNTTVAPVGHRATGGTRSLKGVTVNGSTPKINKSPLPSSGGSISRGGFGVSGGSKGGSGS